MEYFYLFVVSAGCGRSYLVAVPYEDAIFFPLQFTYLQLVRIN